MKYDPKYVTSAITTLEKPTKTRREFLIRAAAGIVTSASAVQAAGGKASKTMPKGKFLRLAIVGTGQISSRYLSQGALSQRARFVATCARTLESAKKRAVEYGIDAWFDDYSKMYEVVKPDGVVIATPNALHVGPTLEAFERGMHVLCEKPMATTWEECRAMVAAAERSGSTFLCMPFDGDTMFLAALNYLNESTLGVFTGAEAQSFINAGCWLPDWYYDRQMGGGAVFNSLVYSVSRLVDMLGPAQRVTGFVNTLIPHRILCSRDVVHADEAMEGPPPRDAKNAKTLEATADDNVSLLIEWANGQQALLRNMWETSTSLGSLSDAVIYGRHGTLWLSDENLVIHSPEKAIADAEPVTWNGRKNCYHVPIKQPENEGLIEHFVDCIQGLKKPVCGGLQRLHVHEILFKGFEAQRTGQTQTLETTFIPWHPIDPVFLDTRSRFI